MSWVFFRIVVEWVDEHIRDGRWAGVAAKHARFLEVPINYCEGLFGCKYIHLNPHVLEWNWMKFSSIPLSSSQYMWVQWKGYLVRLRSWYTVHLGFESIQQSNLPCSFELISRIVSAK
jgi:hypothetical protein